MTTGETYLIILAAITVVCLVGIAYLVRRHHRETQSAMGKLNHSVASVNAAIHLLRGDVERHR